MKKILISIMTIVSLGACFNAYAGVFHATGKIKSISMEGPAFLIVGLTEVGACQVDASGLVSILIINDDKGKEQYSMAFSAYMSDQTIKVKVDDSFRDENNYCYLSWIGLDASVD